MWEKITADKILASLLALFNILLGSYIIMQFLTLVGDRLLGAGYRERGGDVLAFYQVILGILMIIVLGAAWVGVFVYCSMEYYRAAKNNNKGVLYRRFYLVSSLEFYGLSFLIMSYLLLTPMPFFMWDWIILFSGKIIGTIFIILYVKSSVT